jgi:hypothetical protein
LIDDKQTLAEMLQSIFYITTSNELLTKEKMLRLRNTAKMFKIAEDELIKIIKNSYLVSSNCSYEILGINEKSTIETAKKKYNSIIKLIHPDILASNQDIDDIFRKILAERFNQVQHAFSNLRKKQN